MIPKSLSPLPPYPPSYLSKRVKYIQQVFAREASIVSSQEAADAAEDANELYEEAKEEWSVKMVALKEDGEESEGPPPMPVPPPIPAPVHVPPIPIPPCLPDEEEEEEEKTKKAKEQLSIPEDKLHLVSHLDQTCFHVTNGRYSGLITNNFADPQFVGPNAPGITGLNVSGGTGLATSYVGSSSGGGGGASHSSSYYAGVSGVLTNNGSGGGGGGAAKHNTGSTDPTSKKKSSASKNTSGGTATSTSHELKRIMEQGGSEAERIRTSIIRAAVYASRSGNHGGTFVGANGETYPDVSKAFSMHGNMRPCNRCKSNKQGAYHCRLRRKHELKRIMEQGGSEAERIRTSIIRAAVYASRSGNHGGTFVGANGETYPDVSKAFSMHGNMRPCNRCKSNKQGAYHCRLRRKHKDPDYDGGDSAGVLAPFFEEPLEDLLVTPARGSTGTIAPGAT
uniref:Uncharacterized protein n=1 Tax=Ditylum brightwellii TaxID=49249 RepID=A0A7S4RP23_9STRA